MQHDIDRAVGWSIHQDQYLREQYQEWFINYKEDRNAAIKLSAEEYKDARQQIISKYNANLVAIRANEKLPYHRKQQELALNKSHKVFDLDALQKARDKELLGIRENYNTEMQSAYRKFLASQAMDGDEIALEELRRLRLQYEPGLNNQNSIRYVERFDEFRLNITHEIDEHGVINYKLSAIVKEIKAELLNERLEAFREEVRQKHDVDKFTTEYIGNFIKVSTDKFNRESATIKTKDGFFRINEPDIIQQIKDSNLQAGAQIAMVIAKSQEIERTKTKSQLNIEPATKYLNIDDLLLKVDLCLPELSKGKQLVNEGLGIVVEKQVAEYANSDKLYRTVIKTYDGERKTFYLKENPGIKIGDLGYIRQTTGRNFDVVNLNDDLAQVNESIKPQMAQSGIENLEFGKLKKIGLATIRGKDVFYAELQVEVDGVPQSIKKYGESIREQIFNNNLKRGDLIATSTVEY